MEARRIDGADRPAFWLAHVRAGVVLAEVVCSLALLYALRLEGGGNRVALIGLILTLMAFSAGILRLPLLAIITDPRRAPVLFYGWTAGTVAFVTAGALLSGGTESPLVICYALPLVYAASAYPPNAVRVLSCATVLAYSAVAVVHGHSVSASALVVGTLAMTAWMSSVAAGRLWVQVEEQAELARLDGLTRCLNLRTFRIVLDREIARAVRFGHPLALLIIDVDEFKRVNDQRGHLAGDRVLVDVADLLRAQVRRIDVVGRLGGDEFAVLVPETTAAWAAELANRIRVAAHDALARDAVTVSIGVAELDQAGDATQLLHAADVALYAAKGAGRDRICVA